MTNVPDWLIATGLVGAVLFGLLSAFFPPLNAEIYAIAAPVIFLGTGLPEDHWHASDESIDLRMLVRGAATLAHLWRELATAP